MKYRVNVEEILSRIVEVEADNDKQAEDIVNEMYRNEDFVLGSEDFQEVGFYVQ